LSFIIIIIIKTKQEAAKETIQLLFVY